MNDQGGISLWPMVGGGPLTAFEQLFRDRGLPQAIRSDNGFPFASGNSLFGLSNARQRYGSHGPMLLRVT
jgi:hypothetical protein